MKEIFRKQNPPNQTITTQKSICKLCFQSENVVITKVKLQDLIKIRMFTQHYLSIYLPILCFLTPILQQKNTQLNMCHHRSPQKKVIVKTISKIILRRGGRHLLREYGRQCCNISSRFIAYVLPIFCSLPTHFFIPDRVTPRVCLRKPLAFCGCQTTNG